MCCEADLQVVGLLRAIFGKSVQPLLQMISEFIYTGSFNDPFDEFFIEKVYKLNNKAVRTDKVRFNQDFVFKMSSDPSKIPSFVGSSISLAIFKVGSHVNLLQMLDATSSLQNRPFGVLDNDHQFHALVEIDRLEGVVDQTEYFKICNV